MLKLTRYVYVRKNCDLPAVTCNFLQRTVSSSTIKRNSKVSNLKKYWFWRFVDYVKNYESVLKRKFPRTMQVYHIFSGGTKEFYYDLKKYVVILKKNTVHGVESLTNEELKLNFTLRRDIVRIAPVLLISAVPFTNYIIFPLAYYFPRQLLTSHYWTAQQKTDFMILDLRKRLKHNACLFKYFQTNVPMIQDKLLMRKWTDIIACLGSGSHPDTNNIIYCSELFLGPPYGIDYLKRKHLNELLAMHGMPIWKPLKRNRLVERGILLKRMDTAIHREGGVMKMSDESVRWALSFRGLNPAELSQDEMREWLNRWITVSDIVSEKTISLLLHCPMLLAHDHLSNRKVIYKL